MIVGIPKEIKNNEFRVGLTPGGAAALVQRGHTVLVEPGAGEGVGFSDANYQAAGALLFDVDYIFNNANLIVKVKEPQPVECKRLQPGQILFTYLHLASDPNQVKLLMDSRCIAIAYETVTDSLGGLPLLRPMSEVAGRMSVQAGAYFLERAHGGRGVLLPGVSGVPAANVLILGAGIVGINAAQVAVGMGAHVTIMDISLQRLDQVDYDFGSRIVTELSSPERIAALLPETDLVIGAVLIPGDTAPKLITRDMLSLMRPGTVIVDVAIDQGGCVETSHPTTHENPTYLVDGIIHYCVANMPGSVPYTSTLALTNATLPFILQLADKGYAAVQEDAHLANGVNVFYGMITNYAVLKSFDFNKE